MVATTRLTKRGAARLFALTREQEWRFGDIVKVDPGLYMGNGDSRWMIVGYDGSVWTVLTMTPGSSWIGSETHWKTLNGFVLVETMLPVGMPQP